MTKIITISRQFGSGGRTIGKLVAERLGIPWGDAKNYQLSLDSGVLGIEKCVKLIIDCVAHSEDSTK